MTQSVEQNRYSITFEKENMVRQVLFSSLHLKQAGESRIAKLKPGMILIRSHHPLHICARSHRTPIPLMAPRLKYLFSIQTALSSQLLMSSKRARIRYEGLVLLLPLWCKRYACMLQPSCFNTSDCIAKCERLLRQSVVIHLVVPILMISESSDRMIAEVCQERMHLIFTPCGGWSCWCG